MAHYLALLRRDEGSDYGVEFPDFPGCVTAGATLEEARILAAEALAFHIEGMIEDKVPMPAPSPLDTIMADPDNQGALPFLVHLPDPDPQPVRFNASSPSDVPHAVIVDIDGTLANVAHRRVHLEGDKPNWAAFNAAMGDDTINPDIKRLVALLSDAGNAILLCSGRDGAFRRLTESWLAFNEVPYDRLYMRAAGDHRKDHVVKMELLDQILADGFRPWLVVDDRSSVVAAWRARGLTCLQCADGDF